MLEEKENWFSISNGTSKNEEAFSKLCDNMKVGDVIWYASEEPLFKMYAGDDATYFGEWCEDDGFQRYPVLAGESPCVYKPVKLVLNCRFTSPDSNQKTYVFSVFDESYWHHKYTWTKYSNCDFTYPNCGIRGDRVVALSGILDFGNSCTSCRRLDIIRGIDQMVFTNEEDCIKKCKMLNLKYYRRRNIELLRTLRRMAKETKEFIAGYEKEEK